MMASGMQRASRNQDHPLEGLGNLTEMEALEMVVAPEALQTLAWELMLEQFLGEVEVEASQKYQELPAVALNQGEGSVQWQEASCQVAKDLLKKLYEP